MPYDEQQFKYICHCCGQVVRGAPSFSYAFPNLYFDVPEDEREARVLANSDLCVIKPGAGAETQATNYFIRVVLEIPILGATEPFTWGVWVSQSQESFEAYVKTMGEDQSDQSSFGCLSVDLPHYNQTPIGANLEHLECEVRWQSKGKRPKIYLRESEHALAQDQMNGIDWDKATQIAELANSGCHA